MFLLRLALCCQRRAFLVRHRDRGQGPYPQDRPSALPPGLRLRVLAPGSDGAPTGAVVPQDALRDQRLGAHPVRALRLLPALAPGRGVDDGPGAGDRAGDDSRQRALLPASVRAARRGNPRPPERDGGAPRRRDRLAHPGAERDRALAARVAVDLGRQGCRLLPHRPLAQRRGRDEAVRFGQGHRVPGLRPLRRLHQDGARARRQGDSVLVLDPPEARLHRVRRRPGEAEAMVRGMGRAVRVGLPAEQRAAEALRPRSRMPDASVRRGAGRVEEGGRRVVRAGRSGAGRPAGQGAPGQGAALASQASRGTERLRRQSPGPHGHGCC